VVKERNLARREQAQRIPPGQVDILGERARSDEPTMDVPAHRRVLGQQLLDESPILEYDGGQDSVRLSFASLRLRESIAEVGVDIQQSCMGERASAKDARSSLSVALAMPAEPRDGIDMTRVGAAASAGDNGARGEEADDP
jgi:hypothetical protein